MAVAEVEASQANGSQHLDGDEAEAARLAAAEAGRQRLLEEDNLQMLRQREARPRPPKTLPLSIPTPLT